MSITPGASSDHERARLTPRAPGVPGGMDHATSFLGGNLVGGEGSGLDEARGIEPGEGSLLDRDGPIGASLANAQGRTPTWPGDTVPDGAGTASAAGPHSLGTSGGERASAGRADDMRSSRADGNTRQSRPGGLE